MRQSRGEALIQTRNSPIMRSIKLGISAAAIISAFAMNVYAQHVPTVGPQIELAAPIGSIPDGVEGSWTASSGSKVLTIWQEWEQSTPSGYFGTLINPDGTLAGTGGFPAIVSQSANLRFLVASGSKFVAGYSDNAKYFAVRIDSTTGVVDPAPTELFDTSAFPSTIWTAGNGNGFLLVGKEQSEHTILARAYSSDLHPIGGVQTIDTSSGNSAYVGVASDGSGWLVTWQDAANAGRVLGRRVSPAGVLLDASPIVVADVSPATILSSKLTAAGGRYLQFYASSAQSTLTLRPVEADGTVKPSVEVMPLGSEYGVQSDGNTVALSWFGYCAPAGGSDLHDCVALVDSQGAVSASAQYQFDEVSTHELVAAAGGNAVFAGPALGHSPIVVKSVLGPDLTSSSAPLTVSVSEDSAIMPAVAYGGSSFLVVWSDLRAGTARDIVGVRVSADGKVLDASPVALVTRPGDQLAPKVVFDGAQYRLIWRDKDGIRGSLVSDALQMQDPEGKVIVKEPDPEWNSVLQEAVLSTDGTRSLIAYTVSDYPKTVRAVRCNAAWEVLQPGEVTIASETDDEFDLSQLSASYGGHFLVSWIRQDFFHKDIHAALIDSGGQLLKDVIAGPDDASITWAMTNSTSAFGTDRFFVGWETNGMSNYPRGARVGLDGTLFDGNGFDVIPTEFDTEQHSGSVAFDGSEFVVSMEHAKDNKKLGLRLVSVGTDGPPSAPADVTLPENQLRPIDTRTAMSSDCAGHTLLAYESGLGTGHAFVSRIRARMLVRDSAAAPGAGCVIPPPINGGSEGGAGGSGGSAGSTGGAAGNTAYDGGVGGSATGDAGPGNLAESAQSADGGCGCQVPGQHSTNAVHWIALTLGLSALACRKRRRPGVSLRS